ncbi:hypothetical protein M419DRAFT_134079 [Trichoderma reesei RUT C-30]|jgi:hypothetical protein|uniref:Uncharacterized protein n=1 Tax=Hypocrea jecorina (strain ATCC 56765 / BCRC 32924 / NRRL 11460 / Rut C-30) TaxID=1344414 RepID=A0A024S032_HYPJR|nr:hypothetical protein M419DRAFT_134079 [Trichoderma reesei RUT C-30]
MDAERGDPVGDSERGTEETSPLAAIIGVWLGSIDSVGRYENKQLMSSENCSGEYAELSGEWR